MYFYQLAAVADTLIVRNVPPVRTTFEQIVFVASGLTSIFAFLLVCVTLIALIKLRAKADEMKDKIDELVKELQPLARNAAGMYEDVREVAKNVNQMVDESRDTAKLVNDRVRSSVVTLTDRVDDLSDTIGRVNSSANRMATAATATMTGLKLGARVLGLGGKGRKKPKVRADAAERPRLRRRD